MTAGEALIVVLMLVFVGTQLLYTMALGIDLYFYTRRVHWVRPDDIAAYDPVRYPMIVLLYPVLRESGVLQLPEQVARFGDMPLRPVAFFLRQRDARIIDIADKILRHVAGALRGARISGGVGRKLIGKLPEVFRREGLPQ